MSDEPKPQADKFRDLARELEADEDESHFEDALRRIAKAPPPPKEGKAE
jgi:hypothetical protein